MGDGRRKRRGGVRLDACQRGFTEATSICGHVEASNTRRKKENATDLVFLGYCFDILCSFVAKPKTSKRRITEGNESRSS